MRTLQIHSHRKQKEGFALENTSYLKIQRFERNLSHHLLFFFVIYLFQLGKPLATNLLYFWVALLSEGCAGSAEISRFLAAEAKFLLNAVFAFFGSKLEDFDDVHDHGVSVVGLGGQGVGERVVGLVGGFRVPPGDVVGLLPLSLESSGLLVSIINGGRNGIHGHDAAHQGGQDSCREVSDQDVGEGDLVLESRNIFYKGGGIQGVFHILLHAFGG